MLSQIKLNQHYLDRTSRQPGFAKVLYTSSLKHKTIRSKPNVMTQSRLAKCGSVNYYDLNGCKNKCFLN